MLGGEVYLTGEEVCKLLRLSTRTLQDYRDNGTIAYFKIGGKILYRQSDIQAMLERHYNPIPQTGKLWVKLRTQSRLKSKLTLVKNMSAHKVSNQEISLNLSLDLLFELWTLVYQKHPRKVTLWNITNFLFLYTGKVCLCTTNYHLYHKYPCPERGGLNHSKSRDLLFTK